MLKGEHFGLFLSTYSNNFLAFCCVQLPGLSRILREVFLTQEIFWQWEKLKSLFSCCSQIMLKLRLIGLWYPIQRNFTVSMQGLSININLFCSSKITDEGKHIHLYVNNIRIIFLCARERKKVVPREHEIFIFARNNKCIIYFYWLYFDCPCIVNAKPALT